MMTKDHTFDLDDDLFINEFHFKTFCAITHEEQMKGLMFIKKDPPPMCFVYATPRHNSFWMKNTYCPLDIIFCKSNKIKDICFGKPLSLDMIGGDYLSDLIIELPFETCKTMGFNIGDSVKLKFSDNTLYKIKKYRLF